MEKFMETLQNFEISESGVINKRHQHNNYEDYYGKIIIIMKILKNKKNCQREYMFCFNTFSWSTINSK